MRRLQTALLFAGISMLAVPLSAQTQIGGGTCNSSSLTGVYALTLTGRQSTAAGITGIFQANGTATFDGLNKVAISLTANTIPAAGTPLTWSGTYSTQSNCAGVITLTAGSTAALTLSIYNQGNAFLLTGSDGVYIYAGSGNTAPKTSCATGLLSGVYTLNAGGSLLTSGAVTAGAQTAGLLQFDGQGKVIANLTLYATGAAASALTLTGTYSVTAGCVGSATLTDASANSYVLGFSATNSNAVSTRDLSVTLAQAAKLLLTGAAHAVYGQPTALLQGGEGMRFAARISKGELA